jgi:hypothetical protein
MQKFDGKLQIFAGGGGEVPARRQGQNRGNAIRPPSVGRRAD